MLSKALFHIDIKPEWEAAIRDGKKTVDARVNIQPYADVKKGDMVRYSSIHARVKRIIGYYGLNDLLQHEGFKNVVPEAKDINEAIRILEMDLHMHDVERSHGFLALEIEPVAK